MTLNVGELVAYAKVDHAGVGRGIAAAQKDMHAGMDRLQRDAQTGGERAGKAAGDGMSSTFRRSAADLGKGLLGLFAVERVVTGLRAMKDAASDLNETSSMSGVIFQGAANEMRAWAEQGPRLLGLSTEATLRYSAGLADMLLQLGYTQDEVTATSKATLQMAADLGSFKNLQTEDVLERINAALRGEYDSLQLVIPNINAARVEKEALAATGKSVASALSAEEKAAATLAIVQKDGIRASGDFARTRDGEANASKTAAAQAANLAAELGERLLPAYTAVVIFGRDQVIPFLSSAVSYLDATADAAAPVAGAVGDMVGVFRQMPGPIQQATLGLLALVALRGRVEAFGTSVQTRLGDASRSGSRAMDGLRLSIMYASETAESRAGRFTAVTKAIGSTAGSGVRGAVGGLLGVLGGPWGLAFTGATAIFAGWLQQQKEAKDRAAALAETLDQQTGAVQRLTRENVRNTLEQEGVFEAAERLGLKVQDVFDAAFDPAALARLNDETERLLENASGGAARIADSANAGALVDLQADIDKVTGAVSGETAAIRDNQEAIRRKASIDLGAADVQEELADAVEDGTEKQKDQAEVVRDAAKATLELIDAQISAVDTEISYQKSLAAGRDVLKEYGKKLPENAKAFNLQSEAGRAAQEALNDLARDTRRKTEQDAEAGATLGELRSQMRDSRKDFLDLATDLGLSEKAAKEMADEFGLTKGAVDDVARAAEDLPASKQIKIEAETKQAEARLRAVRALLAETKSKSVVVTVLGRFVRTSDPGNTGSRALTGGQTIDSADGNILRFAGGTEDHRAFIAQPGTPTRVFNEPETGGEAYIPLAPAKRPRSSAILATVADEFGYDLIPRSGGRGPGGTGSQSTVSNTYVHNDIRTASFRADYSDVKGRTDQERAVHNLGNGL